MTEFLQITTTTGDREVAQRIATELVDRRLAACVQVAGPIHSTYHWQGAIESDQEWVCTAKSLARRFDEVAQAIAALHPYDVPEVIATPIVAVSDSYARWLRAELAPPA